MKNQFEWGKLLKKKWVLIFLALVGGGAKGRESFFSKKLKLMGGSDRGGCCV